MTPKPSEDGNSDSSSEYISRRTYLTLAGICAGTASGVAGYEKFLSNRTITPIQTVAAYKYDGDQILNTSGLLEVTTIEEDEPNDNRASATTISTNAEVTGDLQEAEVDWFAFDTSAEEPLTIEFTRDSTSGVAAIALYDPDGNFLDMVYVGDDTPVQVTETTATAGTYYIQVIDVNQGTSPYSFVVKDSDYSEDSDDSDTAQDRYTDHDLSRIEAEDFDTGGEDVAYQDTDSENRGGEYREEGVDIQETDDDDGYNIGWIREGEWMEYTVDVPESGDYDLKFRLAGKNDTTLEVEIDGSHVTTVDVPNTGDWQAWTTVDAGTVSLDAATQRIRLTANGDSFNINWFGFVKSESTPPPSDDPPSGEVTVSGEQKTWHKTTLTLDGPSASETDSRNPFLDYRFAVEFTKPSGDTVTVPGYFAADGDAANTSASSGNKWRVNLLADETGTWSYRTIFEEGSEVAVTPGSGSTTEFGGITGSFDIIETDKSGRDFRAHGLLRNPGGHHLRFQGSGEYYLENGANSPENFLGYYEFDQTESLGGEEPDTPSGLHEFEPHERDWNAGDPTWQDDKGKGIIGAVNYLASQGINAHYFLTYNIDGGDGQDTWPWISTEEEDVTRYDVSKLAQWEVVFGHMTRKGLALHLVHQEEENEKSRRLGNGDLGSARKLYYRELIARFSHHPGLIWMLGEEFKMSTDLAREYAAYIRSLDPYDHPIGVHNNNNLEDLWDPLLGDPNFDFGPMQEEDDDLDGNPEIKEWREKTASSDEPWSIILSEIGPYWVGVPCDGETVDGISQDDVRKESLWGALMAGAAGTEWYFGQDTCAGDRVLEDYRTRDNWWDWARYGTEFVQDNLPFWEMNPADGRLNGVSGHGFAHPDGTHYAFYLDEGGDATVDIDSGTYTLRWYNPRTGAFEVTETIEGGDGMSLGSPPIDADAAALLVRE